MLPFALDLLGLREKGANQLQITQVNTIFMMGIDEAGHNFITYDELPDEKKQEIWKSAVPIMKKVLGEPVFRKFFPPQPQQPGPAA